MKKDKTQKATATNAPAIVTVTPAPAQKKSGKKELIKANIDNEADKTVKERLLKYIYPADVKTAKQKKDYRRKLRAEHKKFTQAMNKLRKSTEPAAKVELTKVEKEFASFTKEYYTAGSLA